METCCLCLTNSNDSYNVGEIRKLNKLQVHYFCLLLANTITQSGADHEGVLGFLESDVKAEVERSAQRICTYCLKRGAHIKCSQKGCDVQFHLPCGLKNGTGHQFHAEYPSHCLKHRLKQRPPVPTEESYDCPICLEDVQINNWEQMLWSPCCKKHCFHKICLQKMAISAGGYFFKCPVCNNIEVFQRNMKKFGIFIPDQDASWEREPNAFQELLHRHSTCNAPRCFCIRGRNHVCPSGKYKLILCHYCGSQGIHLMCTDLTASSEPWICASCASMCNSNKSMSSSFIKHDPGSSSSSSSSRNSHGIPPRYPQNQRPDDVIVISSDDSDDEDDRSNMHDPKSKPEGHKQEPTFDFLITDVRTISNSDFSQGSNSEDETRKKPRLD